MTDDAKWQWTSKGPALLLGVALAIIGAVVTHRRKSLWLGLILIVSGAALILFSSTVHGWCAPTTSKFGGAHWGSGFFTQPTVHDCVRLVWPGWK
jgi:hypothetical protein